MKRKHNRIYKRQTATKNQPSHIIMTMPVVRILKDSLANFETLIEKKDKTVPNIAFAQVIFFQLKQKLTDMLEREEWGQTKPLDYNELVILEGCLKMLVVQEQQKENRDEEKLTVCLSLCNQLKIIIQANKQESV